MKPEHYIDGLKFNCGPSGNLVGISEVAVTHPGGVTYQMGANTGVSYFEADNYPRAIIDQSGQYNA